MGSCNRVTHNWHDLACTDTLYTFSKISENCCSRIALTRACLSLSQPHWLPSVYFYGSPSKQVQWLFLTPWRGLQAWGRRQLCSSQSLCPPFQSVQFSSVAQSCQTLCDPMNRSTPGLPVHRQLPEFTQTHVHRVGDAIQPSHPLSSPSPPAPNPSQHQSLFQRVNSLHEVAKVLEFQLQQSFQRTPRIDLL